MKKEFITYKNQTAIRISDIAIIDKAGKVIYFAFNKIIAGQVRMCDETRVDWQFSTKQERDKVYDKILEIINTEIIKL